jgi:hypothetical protein
MKISEVKFYNAIKVGQQELIVAGVYEGLNNKPAYEIELLDNNLIRVKEVGKGEATYTGVYNTVWFRELIVSDNVDKNRPKNTQGNVIESEDQHRRRPVHKAK